MSRYVLEMDNINKAFNGVKVLENVSFRLKEGQVHALVGGNGAGKSTLMKILTGVYTRDSGKILINGQERVFTNYSDATGNGIRMIFQELSVIPTLTVSENIFLNQEITKGKLFIDQKSMMEKAMSLLKEFGIDIRPETRVNTLGVGYCQLVEIAKALSKEAKILIMDEPTASLSETEVNILFQIVNNLKRKGVSIVYISHRMNEILRIADEVTILRDGKNVTTESTENLTIDKIITHMLGEKAEKAFEWEKRHYTGARETLLDVKNLDANSWVKDISFTVHKGEIVGFAGLMGSGRTEIVESLFGITKKLKGTVEITGKPVKINSIQDAIDNGLALVPEDRRRQGLILMHSIKQNIILAIFKRVKKGAFIDDKKTSAIVSESIKTLDIKTDGMNKLARLLSGGNQQKIVIAKWLQTDPSVLLLDEPTAGIDVGAKGEIIQIIRRFADSGKGVLLISSEIAELMAVCDRIIILHDGKITGEMNREDIKSEEVLQHAIQG